MESDIDQFVSDIQARSERGDQEIRVDSLNSILMIGSTGSGKTTLLCLLAQKEIEGFESDDGKLLIRQRNIDSSMEIGQNSASCTTIPKK